MWLEEDIRWDFRRTWGCKKLAQRNERARNKIGLPKQNPQRFDRAGETNKWQTNQGKVVNQS